MQHLITNWQTSIPGIILLVQAIFTAITTKTVDWALIQQALMSLGLLAAKDWNVTGGTKPQ